MTRILFADDDAPVRDGLRTRLYRQSTKWQMTFVDNGARAIEQLEQQPFDVIVTDMRMPGMDGAELLTIASERWPEVVRIVLSGYAERDQALRLVPVAHQYLSKPCDAQRLVAAIDRCLKLRELLPSAQLRARVGRIRALPVMPRVHARLQTAMMSDSIDAHATAEVVASDPVIAAKIVQLANSAFFRLARPIANIDQAVSYTGMAALRTVLPSPAVFVPWPESGPMREVDFEALQAHAHAIAAGALALAREYSWADEALLAGLLHDIGYWVLAQQCPRELADAITLAAAERIALHAAETRVIGATHAQVGAYLLGIWGLPDALVQAVACHHQPIPALESQEFGPAAALVIARALLPTDEAQAFAGGLVPDPKIGPASLPLLNAPFDWAEAEKRISQMLDAEEAVA